MVENEDAVVVRGVAGVEGVVRKRAVGLIALLTTPDRERRFREAVLHSVRWARVWRSLRLFAWSFG